MQALNVWIRRRCIYSHLTVKSGPAQLLFPKDMSPAGKQISAVRSRYTGCNFRTHSDSGSTGQAQRKSFACGYREAVQGDTRAFDCGGHICDLDNQNMR